jgi:hypothetical protein
MRSSQQLSLGSAPPVGLVGAEEILRTDVLDREGDRVGELCDLMLDLRRGRVAYGMVALDHEMGGRIVAVPWNALHIDGDGNLRVNVRREWVERAPSIGNGLMPVLLDHEWAVLIHSYFGTRPYWESNAQHS